MILAHDKARPFQQRGRCKFLNSQHWLSISHYLANHCFLFNDLWFSILRQCEKLKTKLRASRLVEIPRFQFCSTWIPNIFSQIKMSGVNTDSRIWQKPMIRQLINLKVLFPPMEDYEKSGVRGRWGGGGVEHSSFFNLDFLLRLSAGNLVFTN